MRRLGILLTAAALAALAPGSARAALFLLSAQRMRLRGTSLLHGRAARAFCVSLLRARRRFAFFSPQWKRSTRSRRRTTLVSSRLDGCALTRTATDISASLSLTFPRAIICRSHTASMCALFGQARAAPDRSLPGPFHRAGKRRQWRISCHPSRSRCSCRRFPCGRAWCRVDSEEEEAALVRRDRWPERSEDTREHRRSWRFWLY